MSDVSVDFETYSEADLKKVGLYAYFDHPSTEVLCAAIGFDDEEPELWFPGDPCPDRLVDHVIEGGTIVGWNVNFERRCITMIMGPQHGWPVPDLEQYRCTMAEAFAMNLPGKLDKCAPALGLSTVKDDKGHRIMLQLCKPRAWTAKQKKEGATGTRRWTKEEAPEKYQALYDYCLQDVRTERAIAGRVLRLRPSERRMFHLDMLINDRGVYVDEALCNAGQKIVAAEQLRLDGEMRRVTELEVNGCSSVTQLIAYLKRNGVPTDSVAKDVITDLLILDLPDNCRRALELRQEAAKTSVAKIGAMLARRQHDGRMRGNLQFNGAGATGRWAARGAQLQNLTRPVYIKGETEEEVEESQNGVIETVMYGSNIFAEMVYGKPLTLVSDCIRGIITAPHGRILCAADFANIEGRVLAWLAQQEDKLEAFRAYDRGEGPDIYLIAASAVQNVPIDQAKPFRQIGKVCELALGYQGGPRAFGKMAKNYGLKIGNFFDPIWDAASPTNRESAEWGWEERGSKIGMTREAWLAAELVKLAWRQKNNHITAHWKEIEEAAIKAVANPGLTVAVGRVKYRKSGSNLFCQLPSGRALCYPYAKLKTQKTPWGEKEAIVYKASDMKVPTWHQKAFYGGLAVENITQAVARDIMAEAMLRVEDAGYEVVLTVHDEIVAESSHNFGSREEFSNLMTEMPVWATGLPITAAGWRGSRYRKG